MKFALTIQLDTLADLQRVAGLLASVATLDTPGNALALAVAADPDAPGAVNPNAPAADSTGLPWDERIHSPNKTTNQDGSWRRKRGIGDDIYLAVAEELRKNVAGVQHPAPMFNEPTTVAPVTATVPAPIAAAVPSNVVPMMPGATVAPVAAAPEPVATAPAPVQTIQPVAAAAPAPTPTAFDPRLVTFGEFMTRVAGGMTSGIVDQPYMTTLIQRLQVSAITDLASNPEKLAIAVVTMQSEGKWPA